MTSDLQPPLLAPAQGLRPPPALTRAVRTERLVLRPATEADAEPTYSYRRLEEVGRWISAVASDLDSYRAVFVDPDRLATTVVVEHAASGALVGDLMLRVEDAWAQSEVAALAQGTQAELGWALDPAWTGHGYATEAVRALLAVCFQDIGVRRVTAGCFADNVASWRLMERIGMRRESHTVADALHRSGEWLDSFGYALLADEWSPEVPAVTSRLG